MHQKKGLVFCPHFELSDNRLQVPTVQLKECQIRHFALYWDCIVQPVSHSMPKWKRTTDEIVLEDAGILIKDYQGENGRRLIADQYKYSMSMDGAGDIDAFFGFHEKSLKKYCSQHSDVTWIPQQSFREFKARKETSIDNDCILIELTNRLPVPQQNISMKKIVSFKYDHRDLFYEFHNAMDLITVKSCLNNKFSEASLRIAVHDLEALLKDIAKASKFRFGNQTRLASLKSNISQTNLVSAARDLYLGACTGASLGTIGGVLGGALAIAPDFIKFSLGKSKRLNSLPSEQIELSYLTEAYKNKIL